MKHIVSLATTLYATLDILKRRKKDALSPPKLTEMKALNLKEVKELYPEAVKIYDRNTKLRLDIGEVKDHDVINETAWELTTGKQKNQEAIEKKLNSELKKHNVLEKSPIYKKFLENYDIAYTIHEAYLLLGESSDTNLGAERNED